MPRKKPRSSNRLISPSRFLSPNRIVYGTLLLLIMIMGACVKQKIEAPPPFSEFVASAQSNKGSYFITDDSSSVFNIPIGISAVSNTNRVIRFSVSSPSGAVSGQQYTLSDSNSITIPAGIAVDSIPVRGIFSAYGSGRLDTLIFTITGGDVAPLSVNNTYTLTMQQYCKVVTDDLKGDYNNCYDLQAGSPPSGPYTITLSDIVSTGPTTATATMVNLWDVGTTLTLNLDWTNPANFKTIIPQQILYVDPTYGAVTASPSGTGTFSSCSQTFTISYSITVAAGSFGDFVTTLSR
ncbi:MAG: hypothetical protein P4L51_30090 [Puia sp.]|nr:hypothetical protein [Puia sp.]